MDWTNKNIHPTKVVQLGDEVEVMILEIDEERRRISLGMKQCMPNPWEEFAMNHKKGDKVKGLIKSITDFGVFIGLPGGIDGLVHLSDLSWTLTGEAAVRDYKKGRKSRRSCWRSTSSASASRSASSSSTATRSRTTSRRTTRAASSAARSSRSTARARSSRSTATSKAICVPPKSRAIASRTSARHLKEGDSVNAMIINIDRKNRSINLSIKAKDSADETRGDAAR